ncbi:MAG: methyltransferase domain-containing protein, partial [Polyangiales bacterium]
VDCDAGYPQAQVDTGDELREVATLSGAAVVVRRRAIEEVGPPFLDPIFFAYYEETDFFSRAIRKGFRLYYTGEPACWHRVRASSDTYKYLFWMFRNRAIWAYRNFDQHSLDRVLRESARRPRLSRSDEARARRDAHDWLVEHRSLLEEHRAKFFDGGPGFLEAARTIQSRANYYGYERPEVCALVPETAKHVIDVGCASGALGRALKASRPTIEVRGIEPVAEQAVRARRVLDDVMVGEAGDPLPSGWPRPDCIVFADVLEHLVDPWAAVRRARELLVPGGTLVVSIPNVLHHSVVQDLARGRFDYRDAGVLDRTHLRFFTAATARELVEQAGFQVERMERVVEPPVSFLRSLALRTKPNGRGLRALLADVSTVQYLIVAR